MINHPVRASKQKVLYGISFDAVALSGLLVEFYKLAEVFYESGYEIYLDLGYDIFPDKGNFLKAYKDEFDSIPPWVQPARTDDIENVVGYTEEFINQVRRRACQAEAARDAAAIELMTASIRRELTERILKTWEAHEVDVVIVENGTLPENVVYTAALYDAIQQYGVSHGLGKFVLWRDHDLMWSSEACSNKYGVFPYHAVPKPRQSQFIQYAVQHEYNRRRMQDWTPCEISIVRNRFHFERTASTGRNPHSLRARLGIPSEAMIISRLTRIIPQKRIDNELQILARLKKLERQANLPDRAFLAIAGNPSEDPQEFARLRTLSAQLQIEDNLVFSGALLPSHSVVDGTDTTTTADLLAQTTLTSFLTSYDYESFGNPPAESIAQGVQYICSQYELYDAVYGDNGMQALLLSVREEASDAQLWSFASEVLELLINTSRREKWIDHNFSIAKRLFSIEFLSTELQKLFPKAISTLSVQSESTHQQPLLVPHYLN